MMNNTINGRTPDEIKNGLEHCAQSEPCVDCVYYRRDFPICVRRMDGDALAYILQLEAAHRTEYCEDADYDCKRLGDARKRIQQLEHHIGELTEKVAQLEAAQLKWISVEERSPERGVYFVRCIHNYTDNDEYECHKVAIYLSEEYRWIDVGNSLKVTHWMPIPELPKEDA